MMNDELPPGDSVQMHGCRNATVNHLQSEFIIHRSSFIIPVFPCH